MADLHDMLIYKALGGGGSSTAVVPLVVTENGTYTAEEGSAYSPVTVNVSGGGGSVDSGVIFIDYDGSIVTSWPSDEVASKTALPDNPSHTGLIAQGWNWSLANIKSYISKYENAKVIVGQMYETASGLTEIDITVTKKTGLSVICNMVGEKNWGDGTEDSLTSHTYTDYGDYTITCDGTAIPAGTANSGGMFESTSNNANRFWCTAIRIGGSVTSIDSYAFNYCHSLTSITIPDNVTSINSYVFGYCQSLSSVTIPDSITIISIGAFQYCYSITSVAIPDSVTSIDTYAFRSCYSLTSVTIPDGVTIIHDYAFYACYSLASVTIPDNVTSINSYGFEYCQSLRSIKVPNGLTSISSHVFENCYRITEYDFTSFDAVPMVYYNSFTNISAICKIIVPDELYDSWKEYGYWASSYADYIYKASEVA